MSHFSDGQVVLRQERPQPVLQARNSGLIEAVMSVASYERSGAAFRAPDSRIEAGLIFPALTLPLSTRGRHQLPEQAILFALGPCREKEGVGRPVVVSALAEAERPEAVDGDGPAFRGL